MAAYACEPGKGSEPGVGWNWAIQAAKSGNEVHVITRKNNQRPIEDELAQNPQENLYFHYVDFGKIPLKLKKKLRNPGLLMYYYAWQFLVRKKALELHSEEPFDILHHVTFVIDWMPSGLSFVRGVPFIWGPVGGSTHSIPAEIATHLPLRDRLNEKIRKSLQFVFQTFDPLLSQTMERASKILIYTKEARDGIPAEYHAKTSEVIHIGVNHDDHRESAGGENVLHGDADFKVLTNGRLVGWKGFDILVLAFDQFLEKTNCNAALYITSNGPFSTTLQKLIQASSHQDKIHLLGYLPTREDVYKSLDECDLYSLMTFRDGPPVAILEAMNAGKPVLCFDMGAPAELVPDTAGFKASFYNKNYEGLVEETASKLADAYSERNRLGDMGINAQNYVKSTHDWDAIGENIETIYRDVLKKSIN